MFMLVYPLIVFSWPVNRLLCVTVFTLSLNRVDYKIPHRLKRETSISKDVGPEGGIDFEIQHLLFYKGVKTIFYKSL